MIPPPPAPDAVLFRSGPARTGALLAGAAAGLWLLVTALAWAAAFPPDPLTLAVPAVAVLVVLIRMRRRPHWVRVSAAGVEIGTTGARAVLLPLSGVESAAVYGRSLFATLHVVPREDVRASVQLGGERLPAVRICGGRRGYPVAAGLFPGGAAAALAAVAAAVAAEAAEADKPLVR